MSEGLDICKNGLPVATFIFSTKEKLESFRDHILLIEHFNNTQTPRKVTFEDVVENRIHNKEMTAAEGQDAINHFRNT